MICLYIKLDAKIHGKACKKTAPLTERASEQTRTNCAPDEAIGQGGRKHRGKTSAKKIAQDVLGIKATKVGY